MFGQHYSLKEIYESIGQYWALKDEFTYLMTSPIRYSDIVIHTIWKSNYNIIEAKILVRYNF